MSSKFHYFNIFLILAIVFNDCVSINFPSGRAEVGQFRSTVAILANRSETLEVVGTGTLLSPYYVLGSYLKFKIYNQLKILAGGTEWKDTKCSTCQLRIVGYVFHSKPDADRATLMIYRVKKPFKTTSEIVFARLNYSLFKHGWFIDVAGFGSIYPNDTASAPALHWNNFQVVPMKFCNPGKPGLWVNYFCMYNETEPRSNFLNADAGAPVYYQRKIMGIVVPFGAKTSGYNTAVTLTPYQDWIARSITWNGLTHNPNAVHFSTKFRNVGVKRKSGAGDGFRRNCLNITFVLSWIVRSTLMQEII